MGLFAAGGGSGWVVLANSRNPDAAFDFPDNTFAGSVELYETILEPSGAMVTASFPFTAIPVTFMSSA